MLKLCPECKLQISDKAVMCPHCGYPINEKAIKVVKRKKNRKRKLPNGFGQITKINQNLRKPYRAMVTIGKNENGKPICKLLRPQAYFESYNEAYQALLEYNKNPFDLDKDITVKELYNRWSEKHFKKIGSGRSRNIQCAFNYCKEIHNLKIHDLKTHHIKKCMEEGTILYKGKIHHTTTIVKTNIKTLFNQMLDYAIEYEIIDKNCSKIIKIEKEETIRNEQYHNAYTEEEINILYKNINKYDCIDIILIQCYSGWRPNELFDLKLKNIDLEKDIMIGGLKTKSGKNRIVPIHPNIKPLIEKRYQEAEASYSSYLFTHKGKQIQYATYKYRFIMMLKKTGLSETHKPHDGRKHFITIAKKYNLDEYAIKHIVGHTIKDITESVYTERDPEWLKEEMKKIKGLV